MRSLKQIKQVRKMNPDKPMIAMIDDIIDAWESGRGFDRIDDTIFVLKYQKRFIEKTVPLLEYYTGVLEEIENRLMK